MTQNPVNWFEIYVNDMARAKAFYEGVLGVGLKRLDSPVPAWKCGRFPTRRMRPACRGRSQK